MSIQDWLTAQWNAAVNPPASPPAQPSPVPTVAPVLIRDPVASKLPKLADGIAAVGADSVHPQDWADALEPFMVASGIVTPKRIAAFLGQVAQESAGLSVISENLNYGAARLTQVWPSRFPSIAAATPYARNPEALANRVYASRLGNGDERSGDGWRYRGAGLIQLTGKENQTKFAAACGVSGDVGAYLRTLKGAAQSACWFWTTRNLNHLADSWSITVITQVVNGGTGSAPDRINLSNEALQAMS